MQLDPPIPMNTPTGEGFAHSLIDYGHESTCTGRYASPKPVKCGPGRTATFAGQRTSLSVACIHILPRVTGWKSNSREDLPTSRLHAALDSDLREESSHVAMPGQRGACGCMEPG